MAGFESAHEWLVLKRPVTEIFVDSVTDKTFELYLMTMEGSTYIPGAGWSASWLRYGETVGTHYGGLTVHVQRLPALNRLNISPDLIELWAQVVVCGELDDSEGFKKWDEPPWEMKRQELAAMRAPYPDFPFPGHVAVDRLHWLRQKFENANDDEKPRLARELLDRASVAGDKSEANRWIEFLAGRLVTSLFEELVLRADVEEHLRRDTSLSNDIRTAALALAHNYGGDEDANNLNDLGWRTAVRPNAETEEYRRALRWAEAAFRNAPEHAAFVNTLGVLQYRNGLYKESITNLMRRTRRIRKAKPFHNYQTSRSSRWPTTRWANQVRRENT